MPPDYEQTQSPQADDNGKSNALLQTPRIVIIDDSDDDFFLIKRQIQKAWPQSDVYHVTHEEELLQSLVRTEPDLVICDYAMPALTHDKVIELVNIHTPSTPLILLSGLVTEAMGIQAMHMGIKDYVEKSKPERLIPAIRRELQTLQLKREKNHLEQEHLQAKYYDPVSGFLNREGLNRVLSGLLEERDMSNNLCIISINLMHSQVRGSEVDPRLHRNLLSKLITRIRKLFPQHILCRWSDNMLVVVDLDYEWNDPNLHQTAQRLHRIEDQLNQPVLLQHAAIRPNLRIGLARPLLDGNNASELVTHAQSVANVLESRSLNILTALTPAIHEQAKRRKHIELGLAKAIETGELTLHFQPIEDLKTKQLCGLEALVRWHHPELGLIMPGEFIGAAEDSGLIEALGDWVLEHAAEKLQALHQQGFHIWCSVNCSPGQLLNPEFSNKTQTIFDKIGINPKWIEFEITENAAIGDMARTVEALQELEHFGSRIAMDDFGTGYSSLNYLRQLPVHVLKIDKSFVMDLISNQNTQMIVKAVIDLAHALGLIVHAEGIETQEQRELLINMGCDRLQGYWYSRPLSTKNLMSWLTLPHQESSAERPAALDT
jgi:EAL domain-containing protein (putative c-di-GMP-specific phosphodiesterase class I)/PleD family two-component response regulator